MDFQDSAPFKRSACTYMITTEDSERFGDY